MAQIFYQSNILICGSSRVGKTTLMNAICQKELAKSNASLNSNTKTIEQYSARTVVGHVTHETNFWDTPGIESWNENDSRSYMASLIEQTHPLCMIYCASPGSFAALDHIAWMVSECHQKNIFCALVCTNMWAGRNRQNVVDGFCQVLKTVHPQINPTKDDGITYFDRVALVTMVNSKQHVDEDFGVSKPPSGVDELIFGIAKCLERDIMFAWFRTVSENRSFWTTMSSKLGNLLKVPYEKLNSFFDHAENFLDVLFGLTEFDDENTAFGYQSKVNINHNNAVSLKTDNHESMFYDAEMVEMPSSPKSKQLLFTLKSKDMTVLLNNALAKLGATRINIGPLDAIDESIFETKVQFQDDERMKAIYDIYQVINQTETTCTILDDPCTASMDNNL